MQKISMYDFLTMAVSGFLILLLCIPMQGLSEGSILFFIACYVVGMIYHKIMERLASPFRNSPYFLKKGYDSAVKEFEYLNKSDQKMPFDRETYFRAYYLLMEKQCLNSIPVLEAQEAFLRNLIPLLVIYIPVSCCCDSLLARTIHDVFGEGCCFGGLLTIVTIGLAFIWYSLKVKHAALVWEGYGHLKVLKRKQE